MDLCFQLLFQQNMNYIDIYCSMQLLFLYLNEVKPVFNIKNMQHIYLVIYHADLMHLCFSLYQIRVSLHYELQKRDAARYDSHAARCD